MKSDSQNGTLYIIATPIGNMEDITLRALRILKESDVVFCEDTRVTKKLLGRYGITAPTKSFHAHSTEKEIASIISLLCEGKNIALVSDAGTPAISDPGAFLVSRVRDAFGGEARVVPVPGPSAAVAALSASGLPADSFLFLGFLPHKKGRETMFREIAGTKRTVVFYESPHRILKTLASLSAHCPERPIVLARELTKIHEEFLIGSAEELLEALEKSPEKKKGEFVVIVAGEKGAQGERKKPASPAQPPAKTPSRIDR